MIPPKVQQAIKDLFDQAYGFDERQSYYQAQRIREAANAIQSALEEMQQERQAALERGERLNACIYDALRQPTEKGEGC